MVNNESVFKNNSSDKTQGTGLWGNKKTNPFDPYDPHRFTTVAFETRLVPIEGFLMQSQR